jgi:hypothetical protein
MGEIYLINFRDFQKLFCVNFVLLKVSSKAPQKHNIFIKFPHLNFLHFFNKNF